MPFYFRKDADRIAKRLKNIAREAFDPEFRLNWCQKAVAEGLGFPHFHAMQNALPCQATWDGGACAHYLLSNGFLDDVDAVTAVEWLVEELPHVVAGRGRDHLPEPTSRNTGSLS